MSSLKVNEIVPSSGTAVDISATSTTFSGALAVIGNVTLDANLTIDTNVLIVDAAANTVKTTSIMISDDVTGQVSHLTLTNVFDTTSTSASGDIDNADGFIKAYNGTTEIWIPYYTDLA